ncbi:MAG: hypothetical protein HQ526_03970 [Actinobacteria bacterium]|nr:hypothetical protein [Actinomycetota bacterium]
MNTRVLGIGLTVVAVAGLSACTKPTPEVTVVSGSTSAVAPALCWEPDSTVRDAVVSCIGESLTNPAGEVPEIPVIPGNVVGVNVDPEIAEAGWTVAIDQTPLSREPITETYFRFTYPDLQTVPAEGLQLSVVARGNSADKDRGLWSFRLVPSSSE